MDYGGARKRGRHEPSFNGNGGFKKSKQEMESFSPGIGSKSKPCTKFFSTSGCPFGEGCHFLHYVPGGLKNVFPMFNTNNSPALPPPSRSSGAPPSFPDGQSPPAVKNRLCSKYNSAEGCKYGDKCHFAHGEWELGKPTGPSYEDPRSGGPIPSRMGRQMEPQHQVMGAPSGFGATATAKISIDASHAGAIIGKNGVNSKQICRVTGAKLSIRENEMDPNLRNIELEGSFDQINEASAMVRELIGTVSQGNVHGQGQMQGNFHGYGQGNMHGHGQGRGRGRGRGHGPGRGRGRGQGPPMNQGGGHSSSGASNFKTKERTNLISRPKQWEPEAACLVSPRPKASSPRKESPTQNHPSLLANSSKPFLLIASNALFFAPSTVFSKISLLALSSTTLPHPTSIYSRVGSPFLPGPSTGSSRVAFSPVFGSLLTNVDIMLSVTINGLMTLLG
ncbi:Zinc finger CCCH domain-containing protein 14 [Euphorbia peplus]|nr:Zinc finger CCCH domain-containing protein 14 [Euphorbia peplus]